MSSINSNSDENGNALSVEQTKRLDKYNQENALASEGFNAEQILGITKYGLDKEDVKAYNLDSEMLSAIDKQGIHISKTENIEEKEAFKKAFETFKGLNAIQILSITDLELTRNQVETKNFGKHTMFGIVAMVTKKLPKNSDSNTIEKAIQKAIKDGTIQDNFEELKGLNHFQTHGVVHENLSRAQVLDPSFSQTTVVGMINLQELGVPSAESFKMVEGKNAQEINKVVTEYAASQAKNQNKETSKNSLKNFTQAQNSNKRKPLNDNNNQQPNKKNKKNRGKGI